MTLRNEAALDFLRTRRSRPAKTLTKPAPSRDQLIEILEAGTRWLKFYKTSEQAKKCLTLYQKQMTF